MKCLRKMLKSRRGSVMMEAVIVMPILLFLIFLIIQFAHIWTARQMVSYAAFCATRAITVVRPDEQSDAALNAAKMALAWMCLADGGEGDGEKVTVPGWGEIPGARSVGRRVQVQILHDGQDDGQPVAAVKVDFMFPLLIPGMAVNSILATGSAAGGVLDGWPYLKLSETCVLPMPYSTVNFPSDGFKGCSLN